jgi:tetratricopeptide (TPR) repeat protein/TolB-like protein
MRALVMAVGMTWLGLAGTAAADDPQAKSVRIVVKDFEKVAGAERFDVLRRGIAESIQLALLPYDGYQIVARDVLWQHLGELNVPFTEYTPARLFREDVLQGVRADYVVSGSFVELGGNLSITMALRTVSGQQVASFPALRTTERELSARVGSLARRLVDHLSSVVGIKPRTVAVSCFVDKSPSPNAESAWRARDLAGLLARQLVGPRVTTIVDWDAADRVCGNPFASPNAAEPVDAIVTATVQLDGGSLTVSPEFQIDEKRRVRLPVLPVTGKVSEDYGRLRTQLVRRIGEYLAGGLSSTGAWTLLDLGSAIPDAATAVSRGQALREKDPKLALLYFYRALLAQPDHGEARYFAGVIQLKQRNFADAAGNFEKALDLSSGLPEGLKADALRGLAQALSGGSRYADAIRAYERAIQSTPQDIALYRELARVHMFMSNDSEADEWYQRAIRRDPRDVESLYGRGLLAVRSDNEEEASRLFLQALAVDASHEPSKNALADILASRAETAFEAGKRDVALAETEQELTYRESPSAYARRALYRTLLAAPHERDRYLDGIKDYRRALDLLSKMPVQGLRAPVTLNITELYIMTGQYEEARGWATLALREITDSPASLTTARYLLVVAKILAGDVHDADLDRLRADLKQYGPSPGWNFDPLMNFFSAQSMIEEPQRKAILELSDEVRKAPRPGRPS